MSPAAEGWYVDPSTGTNLRFWSGSTWTDEVAPLPVDAPHVDLFASAKVEPAVDAAAGEPAVVDAELVAPEAVEPALGEPEPIAPEAVEVLSLETDLEHTQLTRRELRARRGTDPELDDAPKHLPLLAPPPVIAAQREEPPVEIEIPLAEPVEPPAPEPSAESDEGHEGDDPTQRRRRIVRLSVLLGILTVVSSVGVLTAATL